MTARTSRVRRRPQWQLKPPRQCWEQTTQHRPEAMANLQQRRLITTQKMATTMAPNQQHSPREDDVDSLMTMDPSVEVGAVAEGHDKSPMLEIERKIQLDPQRFEELTRAARGTPPVQHPDRYYDTMTCQLTQKDWWLRLRDGRWELKVSAHRDPAEDPTMSTQFWELEDEQRICEQLGITSLSSKEQRPDQTGEATFEARLTSAGSKQFEADFWARGDTPLLYFQLCDNMHTLRHSIISSRNSCIRMDLDAVTFHPLTTATPTSGKAPDFRICELEIMLKDDALETRRLAEVALEAEIRLLHLDALEWDMSPPPPGQLDDNNGHDAEDPAQCRECLAGLTLSPSCRVCGETDSVQPCRECRSIFCQLHRCQDLCCVCASTDNQTTCANAASNPPDQPMLLPPPPESEVAQKQPDTHEEATLTRAQATALLKEIARPTMELLQREQQKIATAGHQSEP